MSETAFRVPAPTGLAPLLKMLAGLPGRFNCFHKRRVVQDRRCFVLDPVPGPAQAEARGNRFEFFDGKLAILKVVIRRKWHPVSPVVDGARLSRIGEQDVARIRWSP